MCIRDRDTAELLGDRAAQDDGGDDRGRGRGDGNERVVRARELVELLLELAAEAAAVEELGDVVLLVEPAGRGSRLGVDTISRDGGNFDEPPATRVEGTRLQT